MSGIVSPPAGLIGVPRPWPRAAPQACDGCHYSWDDGKDLNCRYNPPTAFVMMKGGTPYVTSAHPIVAPDGWCGRWRTKQAPTTG